jgi:clan AA aspartic protease
VRVSFVVDTGFSGAASINADLIARLGLPLHNLRPTLTADGRLTTTRIYLADVEWLVGPEPVEVYESGIVDGMIGAGLLRGHQLLVDYGPAQAVEIQ